MVGACTGYTIGPHFGPLDVTLIGEIHFSGGDSSPLYV